MLNYILIMNNYTIYLSLIIFALMPKYHFSDNIYGRAAWSNGLDQLTVVPGLHVSYALDFEYGNERFQQRSLSAGIACDAFLNPPEIFAEGFEQNPRLFVTLFATFELGRKWTR